MGAADCGQAPLQRGDQLRPSCRGGRHLRAWSLCSTVPARASGCKVASARGQVARVGCPWRGHKGSARPWPTRRGVTPVACIGAAATTTVQRGKRRI
ncbi:hypothetical protein B296_00004768 [Ensete ventricosum]|uniref:Uncharacterized protein n=1 Tax=Ensete ventricosum TaxID=4639 RepID=A0A426ZC75_ENSVE|nr:hypothetical protein B296_00004768 [Ensete ventricosum]